MSTIVALATGNAMGAVAMLRISGPQALFLTIPLLRKSNGDALHLTPRKAHFALLYDGDELLDEVVATYYQAPHSYTGEDVIEITTHGSLYVVERLLKLLIEKGADLAAPGEFTERAFLNGRMDLSQAEAVNDLISSRTQGAHRAAMGQMRGTLSKRIATLRDHLLHYASMLELEIDFGEEDVEFLNREELQAHSRELLLEVSALADTFNKGEALKMGIPTVIVGPPNAGKSSLLNRLLEEDRAIVTDIPGTTRDSIEADIFIEGIHFRLVDTAGLRESDDPIEQIGVGRAYQHLRKAALSLIVIDPAMSAEDVQQLIESLNPEGSEAIEILLLSKCDLYTQEEIDAKIESYNKALPSPRNWLLWSKNSDDALSSLRDSLFQVANRYLPDEDAIVITNLRHYKALRKAENELEQLWSAFEQGMPNDILASHIRFVTEHLASIVGEIGVEDILGNIFKNFCIGK